MRRWPKSLPPVLREPPAVQIAWWLARPLQFLEHCRGRYGENFMVRFPGAGKPLAFLGDPEAIRGLFGDPQHGLPPVRRARAGAVLGQDSILMLDSGPEHIARRKMVAPGFHGESLRHSEAVVREVTERELAGWPQGATFPIYPRMQAITLEVIVRSVFGATEPAYNRQLRAMLAELLRQVSRKAVQFQILLRSFSPRPERLPAGLRGLLDDIDRVLLADIAGRRAGDVPGGTDMMSLLVATRFEDGSALGDREVRNQLITLLLAGTEATAVALSWAFDMVLRHPEVLARLADEEEEDDAYPRAVVQEALRLRPVVLFTGRRLKADLQVGEYTVPAGYDAVTAPWLTHARADLYPDPLAFHPERFLDNKPRPYEWIPFGGGVRRCIGAAFAEAEMRVVLDTIVRGVSLRPANPRPERLKRNVTGSPRYGTLVQVGERRARPGATSRAERVGEAGL